MGWGVHKGRIAGMGCLLEVLVLQKPTVDVHQYSVSVRKLCFVNGFNID
jgi:hypothetical protein